MLISIFFVVAGFALLIKGGDLFVDASIHIARILDLPRIVIGSTIVSLATTSPEMVVSVTASWLGDSGIALGNALGSTIANLGLIIGISAVLKPIAVDLTDFRRRALWMLAAASGVVFFSLFLQLNRVTGAILLLLAVVYLYSDYQLLVRKKQKSSHGIVLEPKGKSSLTKLIFTFLIGAIFVIAGSRALVFGASAIARALGIPSMIVGLTVIAVGTSLPELVTAVISARKNASDLSVGNIVGANVLNLAGITGIASVIHPLSVDPLTRNYSYFWLFLLVLTMMVFFWKKGRIQQPQGLVFILLYAFYIAGLAILHPFHLTATLN